MLYYGIQYMFFLLKDIIYLQMYFHYITKYIICCNTIMRVVSLLHYVLHYIIVLVIVLHIVMLLPMLT